MSDKYWYLVRLRGLPFPPWGLPAQTPVAAKRLAQRMFEWRCSHGTFDHGVLTLELNEFRTTRTTALENDIYRCYYGLINEKIAEDAKKEIRVILALLLQEIAKKFNDNSDQFQMTWKRTIEHRRVEFAHYLSKLSNEKLLLEAIDCCIKAIEKLASSSLSIHIMKSENEILEIQKLL